VLKKRAKLVFDDIRVLSVCKAHQHICGR